MIELGLPRAHKLDLIAEILDYGLRWLEDSESTPARTEAVEALAHQAACCLCQWCCPSVAVGTAETVEALNLHDFPKRRVLRKLLGLYLHELTL